jgi:hypothetical protein
MPHLGGAIKGFTSMGTKLNCHYKSPCSSVTLPEGTKLYLEAVHDGGYEPGGWSGKACAKTAKTRPCQFTMKGNEVVGASFVSTVVTITLNGSFGAVVATWPGGKFTCTLDLQPCHPPIGVGQTAKFSVPTGTSSYQFAGWGDDCANFGLKSYCTLTIKDSTNITATFRAT